MNIICERINDTQIFCIDNFLSDRDCDSIVEWFSQAPKKSIPDNSFYDNRTLDYGSLTDTSIKKLIAAFKFDSNFIVRHLFKETLYSDYNDLVCWHDGQMMDVHADNAYPDGTPNYVPYRDFTSVLYLNNDFTGGKTFFPNQKVIVTPKKGTFVCYPATLEYSHGVSAIMSGTRYTLASWYTKQKEYIEV